jgi:TP901 family phage tail tape measure protein
MTVFKSISVRLGTNVGTFASEMGVAGGAVKRFGDITNEASRSHANLGKTVAATAAVVGTTLVAALGASVKAAADFEKQMRNVNSLTGLSEAAFRQQSQAVIDLSKQLPQSATTLASGLYEIASSGFQGADGLTVLQASAKAASAGITDTATSAKAITAVLSAYGTSVADVNDISDTLFQTVNLGRISFGELAGTIGDVVGMAAAAGVNIAEVGSAIATMTLAGASGAESGTLLSRTLQGLLKPSETLTLLYRQLGFASGTAAIKSLGLKGVMDQIRIATGGTVEGVQKLFLDIRAQRGVFALLANDGQNYAKVAGQIEDVTGRTGATQKVLNEQMKSFSFQMDLLKNQATAVGIAVGTFLLPKLLSFRDWATDIGRRAMPYLRDAARDLQGAMHSLAPTFDALVDTGRNVVLIFEHLWSAVGPLVVSLASLAGVGIVASLTAMALALQSVTGFLATHRDLVLALASIYAATLVPSILAAATAFGVTLLEAIDSSIEALGVWRAELTATSVLAGGSAVLATGLLALAIYDLVSGYQQGKKAADDFQKSIEKGLDLSTVDGLNQAIARSQAGADALYNKLNDRKLSLGASIEDLLPGNHTTQKLEAQYDRAKAVADGYVQVRTNIEQNVAAVAAATGLGTAAVTQLAKKTGADLTKGFAASSAARTKLIGDIADLGKASGTSAAVLKDAVGVDLDAMAALDKAVADAGDTASKSFTSATDVLTKWDPKKMGIAQFYKDTLKEAQRFVTDISTVTNRGLDASVVSRLISAGPEAARPVLDALLSDNSGAIIKMVNDSEKALSDSNQRVVELSRLTTLAVNSDTDERTRALGNAMRVATETVEQGANATVASVAKATGLSEAEVERVAKLFGISIADLTTNLAALPAAAANGFGGAISQADLLAGSLNNTTEKAIALRSMLGSLSAAAPGFVISGALGSVQSARPQAMGGIEPGVAHMPTILFGERQTGGEAYVPRFGDKAKAMGTLGVAASWYGATVTPMAGGGLVGPGAAMFGRQPSMSSTGLSRSDVAELIRAVQSARPINITPPATVDAGQIVRRLNWDRGY